MEKLIKLLNEYKIELHWVDRTYKDGFDLAYEQEYMRDFRVAYLISKSFWFIKRLVDNNKIDFEKNKLQVLKDIDVRGEVMYDYTLFDKADGVIMLLAISENPIDSLCKMLN